MLGKTCLLSVSAPHAMPVYFLGMLDEAVCMYGDRGLVGVFVIQNSDTVRIRASGCRLSAEFAFPTLRKYFEVAGAR